MTPNLDVRREDRQVSSPPTERVIAVVRLLATEPERNFSLADISRTLGISRATGHAILATLAQYQWVVRDERTAAYCRGPAMDELASAANGSEFRPLLQEFANTIGGQVFLARRDSASLVVTDSVGESQTAPPIKAGLRMPLAAPFGRDFVAWAGDRAVKTWLDGIGTPSPQLRRRLTAVLAQVRERGYVIERLSREYVRVYTALRALAVDGEPDPIAARLAGAFADLTLVDYLPNEMTRGTVHQIATISAPIKDADGAVTMSITAAPFNGLTSAEVAAVGSGVAEVARNIERRLS